MIWRRSQPVEDPWAEEYWADSTEESDSEPKDMSADTPSAPAAE
ncbi:hypothetical protein [Actinomyces ruminis]|nr:hypothetical protein [Actinomyces ruminis]